MSQLYELSRPFPDHLVHRAPAGKHGDYVSHSTVNERALSIVGPYSFQVVELIRGWTPDVVSKDGTKTWPSRDDAVVGCLATLTVTVDDRQVSVTEVGDVEQAAMNEDGRNAKDAASDALKRCWMRLGLGLHLWSQGEYFLDKQMEKQEAADESV